MKISTTITNCKKTALAFLAVLFCLMINPQAGHSQTLIDPTLGGGFENGTTFLANGWTAVQPGNARQWQVGTAAGFQAGTQAAYVGTTTIYNGTATNSVQHFYRNL